MNIDVFFTGLMLICFSGQPNCPVDMPQRNTSWVLQADGESMPCGRYSSEKTKLEIVFPKGNFTIKSKLINCAETDNDVVCNLDYGAICLEPSGDQLTANEFRDKALPGLPRLDEVDRRFRALRVERLKDHSFVPGAIHFPYGIIDVGPLWPTLWFRSNGSPGGVIPGGLSLPRKLSDRLKVTYKADNLVVKACGAVNPLIELKRDADDAEIVFRNSSIYRLDPDRIGQYDDIAYLIWYYRLGWWDTTFGTCPDYTYEKKDAVLLRCVRESRDGCAFYPQARRDTTFWPPTLGPSF